MEQVAQKSTERPGYANLTDEQKLFNNLAVGDMLDVVNILERTNISIDTVDIYGNSLLHWASYRGNLELVQYMLKRGANPEIHNNRDGHTPLHWAALQGELACVHALVSAGAVVDALDGNGHTPLFFSTDNAKALVSHYLIQSGANPSMRDSKNRTPLHMASAKGFTTIVAILAGSGADVNAQDDEGHTPLHVAAKNDHVDVFEDLIREAGASTDIRDNNGKTARDIVTHEKKNILALINMLKNKLVYTKRRGASHKDKIIQMALFSWLSYLTALFAMNSFGFIAATVYFVIVFFLYTRFCNWPLEDESNYYFVTVSPIIFFSMLYCYWCHIFPNYIHMATDWKYHYFSILTQMVLFFSFWYLTLFATDAGVLTINIRDDFEAFKRDISKDTKGLNLCAGCLIRRPIRSKHVRQLGVCVAKFDHYCDWICNAVGEKNHKPFILYVFFVDLFCLNYIINAWGAFPISKEEAWYHRVYDYAQSERLIALTLFFAFFFLLVMGMQLFQQIQFVCVNMTINETMHAPRYVHFWTADKKFINPFDRGGIIANIKDWWSPAYSCRPITEVYSLACSLYLLNVFDVLEILFQLSGDPSRFSIFLNFHFDECWPMELAIKINSSI